MKGKVTFVLVSFLSLSFATNSFAESFSLKGENAKKFKLALLESGAKPEKRPLGSSGLLKIDEIRCKYEAATEYYSCDIHQKSKVHDSRQPESQTIFKTLQAKLKVKADKYDNIIVRVKKIDCVTTTGMGPRTECGVQY